MTDTDYRIEIGNHGCNCCAAGRTWIVLDPDGMRVGRSYSNEDSALEMAEFLSEAFAKGKAL